MIEYSLCPFSSFQVVSEAEQYQSHVLHQNEKWTSTQPKTVQIGLPDVNVRQPNLIASNKVKMGSVDMLDKFVAKYRIAVKSKKRQWPLFINFIDASLCNA